MKPMLFLLVFAGAALAAAGAAAAAAPIAPPPLEDGQVFSKMRDSANDVLYILATRRIAPGSSVCVRGKCDSYDVEAYRGTATLYLQVIAPQYHGYVDAVVRLDASFRYGIADLRNFIQVTGSNPNDPQARKGIDALLKNPEGRIFLPGRSPDLVTSIKKYVDAISRQSKEQEIFSTVRSMEMGRRKIFDFAKTSLPPDDPCVSERLGTLYYPTCQMITDWRPEDLRPIAVLAAERYTFNALAAASSIAAMSAPNLWRCASSTDEQETAVRRDIADARQSSKTYSQLNDLLDDMELHWTALVSSARTCSDPRIWT